MSSLTGDPKLDKLLAQFMRSEGEDTGKIDELRDPDRAWGLCQVVSEDCVELLKKHGYKAYATTDEIEAFYPADKIQPTEDVTHPDSGAFTYPEHTVVSVYPEGGGHEITIDFTAAQYGMVDEFPVVVGQLTPTPTMWHITDNPNFDLDPEFKSEVNATLGGEFHGIHLTDNPEFWINAHNYVRPYIAEVEHPASLHDLDGVNKWSSETRVGAEHFDKLRVQRVIPLDAFAREQYAGPGWIEEHHGRAFDTGAEFTHSQMGRTMERYDDYVYDGPDVREMTPQQHAEHQERWLGYLVENRGFDPTTIDELRAAHPSPAAKPQISGVIEGSQSLPDADTPGHSSSVDFR